MMSENMAMQTNNRLKACKGVRRGLVGGYMGKERVKVILVGKDGVCGGIGFGGFRVMNVDGKEGVRRN